MADLFFYRASGDSYEWLQYDSQGVLTAEGEGDAAVLVAAASESDAERVLVVPGEKVLYTHAKVPSRNARQIAQAVPYVIEEQVATDVEDCFFALGDRNADGDVNVAVIDRSQMDAWAALPGELGIETTRMVSEPSLTARSEDSAVAVLDHGRIHLRVGGSLMTIPAEDLALVVSLLPERPEALQLTAREDEVSAVQLAVDEIPPF